MLKFFRLYPKAINIYGGRCEAWFRKINRVESDMSPGLRKKSGVNRYLNHNCGCSNKNSERMSDEILPRKYQKGSTI